MIDEDNKKFYAPISIYDLRHYFDVDPSIKDLASILANASINQWAKYKPVPLNRISTTDQWNGFHWEPDSDWWKGTDGCCGLYVDNYVVLGTGPLVNKESVKTVYNYYWKQALPKGGISEPFRLTDFVEYSRRATPPMDLWLDRDTFYKNDGSITVHVETDTGDSQECLQITGGDLQKVNVTGIGILDLTKAVVVCAMYIGDDIVAYGKSDAISAEGTSPEVVLSMPAKNSSVYRATIYCCLAVPSGSTWYGIPLPSETRSFYVTLDYGSSYVDPSHDVSLSVNKDSVYFAPNWSNNLKNLQPYSYIATEASAPNHAIVSTGNLYVRLTVTNNGKGKIELLKQNFNFNFNSVESQNFASQVTPWKMTKGGGEKDSVTLEGNSTITLDFYVSDIFFSATPDAYNKTYDTIMSVSYKQGSLCDELEFFVHMNKETESGFITI